MAEEGVYRWSDDDEEVRTPLKLVRFFNLTLLKHSFGLGCYVLFLLEIKGRIRMNILNHL